MGDYIRKFDIPAYSSGTIYNKYDVVKRAVGAKEYYFVSPVDSNIGHLDTTNYLSNAYWKRFDDFDCNFDDIWIPTYTTEASSEPRVNSGVLDDGTTQLDKDGINTIPLKFKLAFENISNKEAKSLLCFCDYIGASRSFFWNTPAPYEKRMTFSLESVDHTYLKRDVNTINMTIGRSYVIFGVGAGQVKA